MKIRVARKVLRVYRREQMEGSDHRHRGETVVRATRKMTSYIGRKINIITRGVE